MLRGAGPTDRTGGGDALERMEIELGSGRSKNLWDCTADDLQQAAAHHYRLARKDEEASGLGNVGDWYVNLFERVVREAA